MIDEEEKLGVIRPDVARYRDVSGNAVFASEEAAGFLPGTFRLAPDAPARKAVPGFEDLPLSRMGRY